jgi:hypothetical protein
MKPWLARAVRAVTGTAGGPRGEGPADFSALMGVAHRLAAERPGALADLASALGRRVQYERICAVSQDGRVAPATPYSLLFPSTAPLTADGRTLEDLAVEVEAGPSSAVDLRTDVVLAWPWNAERLATALVNIGDGRPWGRWRMDEFNHRLEVWLPMGMIWVIGGNHSLTAGIVQRTGTLTPERVRDVSPVFDHVGCDGTAYVRRHDGHRLAEVSSVEMAAWFEVGRLMHQHGVTAWPARGARPLPEPPLGSGPSPA